MKLMILLSGLREQLQCAHVLTVHVVSIPCSAHSGCEWEDCSMSCHIRAQSLVMLELVSALCYISLHEYSAVAASCLHISVSMNAVQPLRALCYKRPSPNLLMSTSPNPPCRAMAALTCGHCTEP